MDKFLKRRTGPDVRDLQIEHKPLTDTTCEELPFITKKLKNSPPSIDGITSPILKYLVRHFTEYFPNVFNWLKSKMAFPTCWKVGLFLKFL